MEHAFRLSRRQHVLSDAQVAVVDLGLDVQNVAHQWIDVDRLEGPHLQILVEGRTHSPEKGLHVHLLVVKAVLSFVELNGEILQGQEADDVTVMAHFRRFDKSLTFIKQSF